MRAAGLTAPALPAVCPRSPIVPTLRLCRRCLQTPCGAGQTGLLRSAQSAGAGRSQRLCPMRLMRALLKSDRRRYSMAATRNGLVTLTSVRSTSLGIRGPARPEHRGRRRPGRPGRQVVGRGLCRPRERRSPAHANDPTCQAAQSSVRRNRRCADVGAPPTLSAVSSCHTAGLWMACEHGRSRPGFDRRETADSGQPVELSADYAVPNAYPA